MDAAVDLLIRHFHCSFYCLIAHPTFLLLILLFNRSSNIFTAHLIV